MTSALAFAAAAVAVVAVAEIAAAGVRPAIGGASRAVGSASSALDAALRLGREGREPGAVERRRLLACGAIAALGTGVLLAGPLAGLVLALAAPTGVSRVLRARRLAYRRAVERAAPGIATALADALGGGHSLRGALVEAAAGLGGSGGAELRRVAAELAAGERTDVTLDRLRLRCASPAIDALATAALVQRRSGGDLATLLRGLARAFEDQRRLTDDARAATAQARFTAVLVVALPLGGAVLAELASPGFAGGLAGSPLTAWLVGLALALQVAAAALIRRLGRPPA